MTERVLFAPSSTGHPAIYLPDLGSSVCLPVGRDVGSSTLSLGTDPSSGVPRTRPSSLISPLSAGTPVLSLKTFLFEPLTPRSSPHPPSPS